MERMNIMRLENKICAITGAGGGIGRVAADIFAKEGATVLILELNAEAANKAVLLILIVLYYPKLCAFILTFG